MPAVGAWTATIGTGISESAPGVRLGTVASASYVSINSGVLGTRHLTPSNGLPARQARGFEATNKPSTNSEKYFILAATDDGYIKMALIRVYISGVAAFAYVEKTKGYTDGTASLAALTTSRVNDAFANGFDYDYDVDTMVGLRDRG